MGNVALVDQQVQQQAMFSVSSDASVKESMAAMRYEDCPSWVKAYRSCGCEQWIQAPCSSPACIPCERLRVNRVRKRWAPVVEAMDKPRLLTLTVRSGFCLESVERLERESFRRWLDLRLGPKRWPEHKSAALAYLTEHYQGAEGERLKKLERRRADLNKFDDTLERFREGRREHITKSTVVVLALTRWRAQRRVSAALVYMSLLLFARDWRRGVHPRVRDLLRCGFSSREVTWGGIFGWHPHRHLCFDGAYLPWSLIIVTWAQATRGAGEVVDIRAVKPGPGSMLELVKYVSKAWDVPEERVGELVSVLKGKKRIWPIGNAKPAPVESVCPGCDEPECEVTGVRTGHTMWRGKDAYGESVVAVLLRGWDGEPDDYVYLKRVQGSWCEVPLYSIDMCNSVPSLEPPSERVNANRARDGPAQASGGFDESLEVLLDAAFGSGRQN